jgi:peptidoglycan/LPS O-acetylase OafA/YrhL
LLCYRSLEMRQPATTRRASERPRGLRAAIYLGAVGLVAYHAWLFTGRLRDASIREPEVLLRWLLAAGLIGLAVAFQRRGHSIVRGRSAIVFWVLALLLHIGPLPAPAVNEAHGALVLPLALAAPFLIAVFAALAAPLRGRPHHDWIRRSALSFHDGALAPLALRFAPRPPPAA